MKKILGIAIGGTKSAICLSTIDQLEVKNLFKQTIKTNPNDSDYTIGEILKVVDKLDNNFDSISIICGGPLNSKKGLILKPSNLPGFNRVNIVKIFKQRYKKETKLLNDADASALAEYYFGSGKGTNNFIYLTFGTGIGAGLILNGKLFSGTNDCAGEIGHTRVFTSGHKARNGKKGSVESFASGGGVEDCAKALSLKKQLILSNKDISAKDVFDAARKGDEVALEVVKKCSIALGRALGTLIDLFNPECIAIGGIYPRAKDLLEEKVLKVAKKESLKISFKNCKIVPSELGDKIDEYSSLMASF